MIFAPRLRYCLLAAIALSAATILPAGAETVEVAPGVSVTKKSFPAPVNQQPFFGFVEPSARMREANEQFVASVRQQTGSQQKAFDAASERAWSAFFAGDLALATRRFNQAYLLDPTQSSVFHGLGLIAFERFHDPEFAEELLRIAGTAANPSVLLNADYGRFLLINDRPHDAARVLEKAVVDAPRFASAWSNLAWARYQNGDLAGACSAITEAERLSPAGNVRSDIDLLREQTDCS